MDIWYLLLLQNMREALGGIFDNLMLQVTSLGEIQIAYLLLALVYWCIDKRTGEFMCLNASYGLAINQIIKEVCCIARPWNRDSRIQPVEAAKNAPGVIDSYSFPSGHTAIGTSTWGALGASLWHKKLRAAAVVCFGVLAVVGFSRNYLGVHTPQDVLVSLAIGIVLIIVLNKVLNWANKGKNRDLIVAGVGIVLSIVSIIVSEFNYAAGVGIGFLLGWVLERRFVKFTTDGTLAQKCVRFGLGVLGIWYIYYAFSSAFALVLPDAANFIAMTVMALFITFLYPLVFCKKSHYKFGIILAAVILAVPIVVSCVCGAAT